MCYWGKNWQNFSPTFQGRVPPQYLRVQEMGECHPGNMAGWGPGPGAALYPRYVVQDGARLVPLEENLSFV